MRQEIDYGLNRYKELSLLWLEPNKKEFFELSKKDMLDLNIHSLYEKLSENRNIDIYSWLNQVPNNQETSVYRQKIMKDFVENDGLFQNLYTYGEQAHKLMAMSKFAFEKEATVYNVIKRMDEVIHIREMTDNILLNLQKADLHSTGLQKYLELLVEIVNSPIYEAFMKDVEAIKALEDGVNSIIIGLNLDEYLQPVEAILLEMSQEEFKYSRTMKKMGYYINHGVKEIMLIPRKIFARETVLPPDALNTLEKTIEPATLQLIKFCDQFNMKVLEVLSVLYHELPYYQIGLDLYDLLNSNNEMLTLPKWQAPYILEGIYHFNLGINREEEVIKNTIILDKIKRIMILTGANRGGKTTITQAIAISLWFGQLGFYIPGVNVSIPYVSNILVHFPREEQDSVKLGRLGEECQRFKELFLHSNKDSFYFMNESFLGTSHTESVQIALETIKAIYNKGSYLIFNTHLHELVDVIEQEIVSSDIKSFIAGKDMKKSPFIIEEGRPLGKSYAHAIAKRYGMLYEQLINKNK